MNLFDLSAKITLDSSGFDKGVQDAAGKGRGLASTIGGGLATAAKVGAAGLTAAASGIAALTGASVKNYAEYEQLVGGVETLFGESAGTVQEYASQAFQTAGMSANEYMETVTGFSASLLQSLDGDTAAAAEKANQALVDMSDNANKMGTDIESIKNAYGGFAKQNFTMLDNLKLGYGGTKEEMERLLEDAEKISGIEYDVSSYADIVDAIHVVQTEMGITGTTAAEASSTISGSVQSMKSAWTNLTTGLADENANIDELLDQFLNSVDTVADNILPVIERILGNISGKIIENFPEMAKRGAELLGKVAAGIIKAIPDLIKSIPEVVDAIVQGFKDADMDWLQIGKDLIMGVWEGIKSLGGWLYGKVSGFFEGLFSNTKEEEEIHSPSKKWARIGGYMAQGVGVGWDREFASVRSGINSSMDFKTGRVSFADSGLGMTSAQIINSNGSGFAPAGPQTVELVLKSQEGQTFGRWMVPFIRSEDKSNPEVVSDPV